ncbi:hypothetical protein MYX82_12615 [Acidobacteria bacterium AH-259-D05]|nr:hypothetical protein [Acidobacteria bacterium AH-259-D05]
MSPKHISEVYQQMLGFTIKPQGVRNYLKAYGFYTPPKKEQGRYCYQPDYQGLDAFLEEWEKVRRRPQN